MKLFKRYGEYPSRLRKTECEVEAYAIRRVGIHFTEAQKEQIRTIALRSGIKFRLILI